MSETKFKFEDKSVVCNEEGHKPLFLFVGVTAFNQHILDCSHCFSSKPWEFSLVQLPLDTGRWLGPQQHQETRFLSNISRKTKSRPQIHSCTEKFGHRLLREVTGLLLISNSSRKIYALISYRPG